MTFTRTHDQLTVTEGVLVALLTLLVVYHIVGSPEPLTSAFLYWNPVLLVVAVAQPLLACTMFVAFSLFRLHEAYPILLDLKIPLTLGTLTMGSLGIHAIIVRSLRPTFTLGLFLFAVFFVLSSAGIVFATNRANSLAFWQASYWKMALMTFALAWLTHKPSDFALATRVIVVSGALVGAVAIFNRLNGIDLVEGTRVSIGREIRSVLGDPNDLSLILLFPLGFAVALAVFEPTRIDKVLCRLCAPILLTSIIMTQSRGGLLGILAICGVIGSRFVKSKMNLLVIGTALMIGLFFLMGIGGRLSGGAAEFGSGGVDESMQGRLNAWRAAVNMALAKPLTGVGMLNFPNNYFFYTPAWGGKAMAVHSTWFGVLAETGFVCFFVYLAMVVSCLRSCWSSLVAAESGEMPPMMFAFALGLLAALVGFVVAGSFLTQGFTWPPYLLLGLTAALDRYTRDFIAGRIPDGFPRLERGKA